jgi:hypothetical protein
MALTFIAGIIGPDGCGAHDVAVHKWIFGAPLTSRNKCTITMMMRCDTNIDHPAALAIEVAHQR